MSNQKEFLNENNSISLTGMTFKQVLSLSGIYGIYTAQQIESFPDNGLHYLTIFIRGNVVVIDIETDLVDTLVVHVFLDSRTITNEEFRCEQPGKNFGIRRLASQVECAEKLGFSCIDLWAYGNFSKINEWVGYIIWGKYGFLMASEENKSHFARLMQERNRTDKDLYELLSTKEGEELWKVEGFEWLGEFLICDNSRSLQILKEVRQKKNL